MFSRNNSPYDNTAQLIQLAVLIILSKFVVFTIRRNFDLYFIIGISVRHALARMGVNNTFIAQVSRLVFEITSGNIFRSFSNRSRERFAF